MSLAAPLPRHFVPGKAAAPERAPVTARPESESAELPVQLMIEGPMSASLPIDPENVESGLRLVSAEIKSMIASRRERRVTAHTGAASALMQVGPAGLMPMANGGLANRERHSFRFRALHVLGMMMTLPLFAVERLLLGAWCEWQGETVYTRANRTVLMALDYIFVE